MNTAFPKPTSAWTTTDVVVAAFSWRAVEAGFGPLRVVFAPAGFFEICRRVACWGVFTAAAFPRLTVLLMEDCLFISVLSCLSPGPLAILVELTGKVKGGTVKFR